MRKLIIFIGPQGAGKTTQAILLKERLDSLGVKTRLITLIHYAVFHLRFNRFVNTLCRDNKVMVKFYEDLPPTPSASPEVYRRLFPLLIILHFLGFTLSVIKLKLLQLRRGVIIEHEGYVFKQTPDILFLSAYAGVSRGSRTWRLLVRLITFLLRVAFKDKPLVILLRGEHSVLKPRYARRPHIEPSHYINFQNAIYERLAEIYESINGEVLRVNAALPIMVVYNTISGYILSRIKRIT